MLQQVHVQMYGGVDVYAITVDAKIENYTCFRSKVMIHSNSSKYMLSDNITKYGIRHAVVQVSMAMTQDACTLYAVS